MPEIKKIIWSLESSRKVTSIKEYLYNEWTEEEVKYFIKRLMHFEKLVTQHPEIFPVSKKSPNLRKAVITKYQSVIYEIDHNTIKVHTILDHRQKN